MFKQYFSKEAREERATAKKAAQESIRESNNRQMLFVIGVLGAVVGGIAFLGYKSVEKVAEAITPELES